MKRIAVFSDIHGNLEALQSILKDIKSKNIDEIIYLGDAIAIGPESKECLELIKKNNIKFILGNHELYYLYGTDIDDDIIDKKEKEHFKWVHSLLDNSDKEYLKNCALSYEYIIGSKKLLFTHYLINNKKDLYPYLELGNKEGINKWLINNPNYEYIFVGHEHNYLKNKNVNNIWYVSSAGCTKDNKTTYTIIEIDKVISISRVFIDYDRDLFINKLNNSDYPDKEKIMEYIYGIKNKNN